MCVSIYLAHLLSPLLLCSVWLLLVATKKKKSFHIFSDLKLLFLLLVCCFFLFMIFNTFLYLHLIPTHFTMRVAMSRLYIWNGYLSAHIQFIFSLKKTINYSVLWWLLHFYIDSNELKSCSFDLCRFSFSIISPRKKIL